MFGRQRQKDGLAGQLNRPRTAFRDSLSILSSCYAYERIRLKFKLAIRLRLQGTWWRGNLLLCLVSRQDLGPGPWWGGGGVVSGSVRCT